MWDGTKLSVIDAGYGGATSNRWSEDFIRICNEASWCKDKERREIEKIRLQMAQQRASRRPADDPNAQRSGQADGGSQGGGQPADKVTDKPKR